MNEQQEVFEYIKEKECGLKQLTHYQDCFLEKARHNYSIFTEYYCRWF